MPIPSFALVAKTPHERTNAQDEFTKTFVISGCFVLPFAPPKNKKPADAAGLCVSLEKSLVLHAQIGPPVAGTVMVAAVMMHARVEHCQAA